MEKILYVGMDVHKDCIVIAVLGADGKLVMETVIENKSETLRQFIRGLAGRAHVTLEEGTHAAWLYDLLRPHVARVIVCDPRQNKLLGAGSKSDRIDARKLAQLLRAGLLKAVYHGECGTRPLKELVGSYESLVEDTTRVMNRIKALYRARGVKCEGAEVYQADQRDGWLAKLADSGARARATYLYRELEYLLELRGESRQQMLAESRRHAGARHPQRGAGVRADPYRTAHRDRRHSAPLPDEAAVLGLCRVSRGDQKQCRLPHDKR